MQKYVLGFITDENRILLVKEEHPKNGNDIYSVISGKVSEEQIPLLTIIQKTKELTGLDIKKWSLIDILPFSDNDDDIFVYHSTICNSEIENFNSLTKKEVKLFDIESLPNNLIYDIDKIIKHKIIDAKLNKNQTEIISKFDNPTILFKPSSIDEIKSLNLKIGDNCKIKKMAICPFTKVSYVSDEIEAMVYDLKFQDSAFDFCFYHTGDYGNDEFSSPENVKVIMD